MQSWLHFFNTEQPKKHHIENFQVSSWCVTGKPQPPPPPKKKKRIRKEEDYDLVLQSTGNNWCKLAWGEEKKHMNDQMLQRNELVLGYI